VLVAVNGHYVLESTNSSVIEIEVFQLELESMQSRKVMTRPQSEINKFLFPSALGSKKSLGLGGNQREVKDNQ